MATARKKLAGNAIGHASPRDATLAAAIGAPQLSTPTAVAGLRSIAAEWAERARSSSAGRSMCNKPGLDAPVPAPRRSAAGEKPQSELVAPRTSGARQTSTDGQLRAEETRSDPFP